jgi:hypothetical protein
LNLESMFSELRLFGTRLLRKISNSSALLLLLIARNLSFLKSNFKLTLIYLDGLSKC